MTPKKNAKSRKNDAATGSTVNAQEIAQFDRLGEKWWDINGPMRPLHRLNPVRLKYIEDQILAQTERSSLKGLRHADIGCGGGLVAEPLARLGMNVSGIDAGSENIKVAAAHAKAQKLHIDYRASTVEAVAAVGETFDSVTALEIVEHVDDLPLFVKSCCDIVAKDGVLIFSTLNRTPKSFALGIVAAEYILRWLPPGTHNWKKFVKPSELSRLLRQNGFAVRDVTGLVYRMGHDDFALDAEDIDVNYLLTATRA